MKLGEKLSEDLYVLNLDPQGEGINELDKSLDPKSTDGSISSEPQKLQNKKIKSSSKDTEIVNLDSNKDRKENAPLSSTSTTSSHSEIENLNNADRRPQHLDAENEAVRSTSIQLMTIYFNYFHPELSFVSSELNKLLTKKTFFLNI